MTKTFAALFSGFDGAGVGAKAAGYTHLWGVEFDPAIAEVAQMNGFNSIVADVREADYSSLPRPDHLHASPVCKNASIAKAERGEAQGDIETADAVCRAIRELQPDIFTLENVRGYEPFESFRRIVAQLREMAYGVQWSVLNAADYGVPQTRERLILRAVRGSDSRAVKLPRPTHSNRPRSLFDGTNLALWVGWHEAIADILDTLPDSEFAPWQLARLPKELTEGVMMDGSEMREDGITRLFDSPMFTVKASSYKGVPRAFVVSGTMNNRGESVTTRLGDEPYHTLTAQEGTRQVSCAFLIPNDNTKQEWGKKYRDGDEPAPTGSAGRGNRALLVGGANTSARDAYEGVGVSELDEPTRAVNASNSDQWRASMAGRVVRMTPRALARFQSFPDSYKLPDKAALAMMGIGNAVPPLLMQRVCEVTA